MSKQKQVITIMIDIIEVEKEITNKTKQQIEKCMEQGRINSNMLWNMRRKLMGKVG